MTPPPSIEAIDKLDDAIYKLCNLRNSTAFSIGNTSWAELHSLNEKDFTFNSVVNMNPKQAILALGEGCKKTSPIGHLESSLNSLKTLISNVDRALGSSIKAMEDLRSKSSTKRSSLVMSNGLASLPDNVIYRIFTYVPYVDWCTVVRLFKTSLLCRRLHPIISKVAKTWTLIRLPVKPCPILQVGLMKYAPNAELRLDSTFELSKTHRAGTKASDVLELISHHSFWSSFAHVKVLDGDWLETFALIDMKDFEKHLPKEIRGPEEMRVGGVVIGCYYKTYPRKLSEKELSILDRVFQGDIAFPNLSTMHVRRWVPGNLPRNITHLIVTLSPFDDNRSLIKLLDTLKDLPKLESFEFTYTVRDGYYPLDDVSTTVTLPSLTTMSLDLDRRGFVDGISRFLRLFQLPRLENLHITYTIFGDSDKSDVVDGRVVKRDGDDIKSIAETGSQCVLFTILEKHNQLPLLKVFSLAVYVDIYFPVWRPRIGFKVLASKGRPFYHARSSAPPADPEPTKLLPIWVDIPFENMPSIKEAKLCFEDHRAFVHLPSKLRLPSMIETLSFEGLRGLQWKWLSGYLKGLKKTREWDDLKKLRIVKCEIIDKNVKKLRLLVTEKQFTYEESKTKNDPFVLLL